jgi:hypothetical protein
MTTPIDVVRLARGLGFQIDQVEDDESDAVVWRWLAKEGLADALTDSGNAYEEIGFASEVDAARQALAVGAEALSFIAEAY